MKRIFFLLLVVPIIFSSCSKDKEEEPVALDSYEGSEIKKIIDEYSIRKQGLKIESFVLGTDTTIFFNGRINGKLWVGGFETKSKEQILDWIENEKLDTVISYHKGYGVYDNLMIKKFVLAFPYKYNNSFCFLLRGHDQDGGMYKSSCDLYFLQNNVMKKLRTIYSAHSGLDHFVGITPWHHGIVVKKTSEKHVCFNMQGDSLFTINSGFGIKPSYSPINYEECIDFSTATATTDLRMSFFRRLNLKTNETIWKNEIFPLNNLPKNTRFDNYTITKANNEWTYNVNYTLFDGTKSSVRILLNIENGKFELK